tara:strand:+ start:433 stop:1083 length:651 start_codon:yes stop_codon:yes gene_type:complete
MNYSLNTKIVNPVLKPNNIVILCHGYGGDGNDISILANYWKNFLPQTIFLCPNAPEICKVNPNGFQWFDLMDQTEDEILSKSLIAENILSKFIDEVLEINKVDAKQIALVGFSQGCMISLQTALKRRDEINCLIGFSGKIINSNHLSKNIVSRPEIYLMHGDIDQIVPVNDFLAAKEFFLQQKYKIYTQIFKNCEHRIPTEGLSIGLEFLKKNFSK